MDQISIKTPFYKDILTLIYSLCMVNTVMTGSILMLRLQFNCLIEHINIEPHTLFDDSKRCIDKGNFIIHIIDYCSKMYFMIYYVSDLTENIVKELKNGLIVNTKQIYRYFPQLNNYRSLLENKVNNKKIKFLSPTVSVPSQKINQNRRIEVGIQLTKSFQLKVIEILILVGVRITFL